MATAIFGLGDLSAIQWGKKVTGASTNPTGMNKKLSKSKGWSLSLLGKQMYKTVSSVALSKAIYCLQHTLEVALKTPDCFGSCTPDIKSGDCYNRDGMLGGRTMEFVGFIQFHGEQSAAQKLGVSVASLAAAKLFIVPKSVIKDYSVFIPATDVVDTVVAGEGTAGQVHQTIVAGGGTPVTPTGTPPVAVVPTKSNFQRNLGIASLIGSVAMGLWSRAG